MRASHIVCPMRAHCGRTARVAVVAVAITGAACAPLTYAAPPHLIVFGKSIGGISIGDAKSAVDHLYGRPLKLREYNHGTTREWSQTRYRIPSSDGALWVDFRYGHVVGVETSSRIFHTDDGLHPGLLIHNYECDKNGYQGSCDRWLLGFRWRENCNGFVHTEGGITTLVTLPPADMTPPTRDFRQPIDEVVIGEPAFTTGMAC
jgi:hypothetical protein